ncbi:hypothetical protein [Chondromyces crocatus]|nr:hypothetical protein [Chondromyces crocatus]
MDQLIETSRRALGVAAVLGILPLAACNSQPATNPTIVPAQQPAPVEPEVPVAVNTPSGPKSPPIALPPEALPNPAPGQATPPTTPPECRSCWVQIWEDKNFKDDTVLLCGPGRWSHLRALPGEHEDWHDEIESLMVGSDATVIVWGDENFQGPSAEYHAGAKRADLHGRPDLDEDIESIEIRCR